MRALRTLSAVACAVISLGLVSGPSEAAAKPKYAVTAALGGCKGTVDFYLGHIAFTNKGSRTLTIRLRYRLYGPGGRPSPVSTHTLKVKPSRTAFYKFSHTREYREKVWWKVAQKPSLHGSIWAVCKF